MNTILCLGWFFVFLAITTFAAWNEYELGRYATGYFAGIGFGLFLAKIILQ